MIKNTLNYEDIPALYTIERGCFLKDFRWSESVFRREVVNSARKNNLWVYTTKEGVIAGFLMAAEERGKGYIQSVDVSKEHRKKGIATELILECEKAFKSRGINCMRLEVHVNNPAQTLYFKIGYRS